MEGIQVETYLERALTHDLPIALLGKPRDMPRVSVLDARCPSNGFLRPLTAPGSAYHSHYLVEKLGKSLDDLGYLRKDAGIVLSLSGGVDSMVTCCLLWLLVQRLPQEQRFRWCAMHLCHPNRDDAPDEEGWVQWSCAELGVQLFTYRPEIRRPHGQVRTGISRERYEEKSKQIRFRMYELCLGALGVPGAALVAHHSDDADENRLAELGKGNVLHIDGMSASSCQLNVTVLRPLLHVRKQELIDFACEARVPHMLDSTPKWSRRGWIRHVLDEMKLEDSTAFEALQGRLSRAGAASEALGDAMDESLASWKCEIRSTRLQVPPLEAENGQYAACHVLLVSLSMPILARLALDFQAKVSSFLQEVMEIARVWNQAIGSVEATDEEAGSCPLQPIRVSDGFETGPFVLSRAVCAAMNLLPEAELLLKSQLPARKALKHVWDAWIGSEFAVEEHVARDP